METTPYNCLHTVFTQTQGKHFYNIIHESITYESLKQVGDMEVLPTSLSTGGWHESITYEYSTVGWHESITYESLNRWVTWWKLFKYI